MLFIKRFLIMGEGLFLCAQSKYSHVLMNCLSQLLKGDPGTYARHEMAQGWGMSWTEQQALTGSAHT